MKRGHRHDPADDTGMIAGSTDRAGHRARIPGSKREAVERKLRLWSGLLIAAYVVLHLSNHALGLVSIAAMERARASGCRRCGALL